MAEIAIAEIDRTFSLSGDLCLNSLTLSAMSAIPIPSVWMANGVCAACFKGDWEEPRLVELAGPGPRQFDSPRQPVALISSRLPQTPGQRLRTAPY